MTIVLDSNVLVAAIGTRNRLRPIWDAFLDGRFHIAVSEDILKEYEEILYRLAAPGVAPFIMGILEESLEVKICQAYYKWRIITVDPDDNKFFDIAVASNADFLVTNDHHFNIAKKLEFPKIGIITPDEFMEVLENIPLD
ncbi:putative toxin-antitoxin system toxin component, PIN family [Sphingobacterium thalpophilum]|uniref:putative toxin-antitoxin system toxin component, PIN family n=1 Tax=Sphingobacterium thalpophilum TaxID=259 RepID=UPI002D79D72F|nr:putative toxin-antitoxin system toxin component, PIN family [Sphingobacterium thalpophilum]